MKRYTCLALVTLALMLALALLVVAGCGGSSPNTSGADTSGNTVDAKAVGVPTYPGTTPEEVYPDVYRMVTTDGYAKVAAFYKEKLTGATTSEITIPTGRAASFMVTEDWGYRNVSVEENVPESGRVSITVTKATSK